MMADSNRVDVRELARFAEACDNLHDAVALADNAFDAFVRRAVRQLSGC